MTFKKYFTIISGTGLLILVFGINLVPAAQAPLPEKTLVLVKELPIPDYDGAEKEVESYIFQHFRENSIPALLQISENPANKSIRSNALVVVGYLVSVNKATVSLPKLIEAIEKGAAYGDYQEKLDVLAPGYVTIAKYGGAEAFEYLTKRADAEYWLRNPAPKPPGSTLQPHDMAISMSGLVIHAMGFFTEPELRAKVTALKDHPAFKHPLLQDQIGYAAVLSRKHEETLPRLRKLAEKHGMKVSPAATVSNPAQDSQ